MCSSDLSATSLIQWFLAEGTNRPTGRRSSDQIVRRFRQKVLGADTPERLSQALDLLRALAGVLAAPAVALQRGEEIAAQFNLEAAPLASLRSVLDLLAAYQLKGVDVQVDLGLNRPLGYYTGLVFELYADEEGSAIDRKSTRLNSSH